MGNYRLLLTADESYYRSKKFIVGTDAPSTELLMLNVEKCTHSQDSPS